MIYLLEAARVEQGTPCIEARQEERWCNTRRRKRKLKMKISGTRAELLRHTSASSKVIVGTRLLALALFSLHRMPIYVRTTTTSTSIFAPALAIAIHFTICNAIYVTGETKWSLQMSAS